MPCWTSNRCSTRQSAPLRCRRLCRAAAGQLEQRREMQRRRCAECEAMDGGDLSWKKMFALMILCEWFEVDIWFVDDFEYLVFSCLFLRLCWLVLKSHLFRFDFLIYIICRNFERLGRWAQQQQNIRESSRITAANRHPLVPNIFSIDRRPPVFGTTSQSVKSGNLFLLKQTLGALGIFISWTWILETC